MDCNFCNLKHDKGECLCEPIIVCKKCSYIHPNEDCEKDVKNDTPASCKK